MIETRKFTCIVCPRGCALEVDLASGAAGTQAVVREVRGNACKRGEDYGRTEVLDPRRSLTSTVRVEGLGRRRLPVRSSGEIPLARLVEASRALDAVVVRGHLHCGDIVMADLLGLGVDVVATDDL